jgi:hypothetical protein
LRVVVLCWDGNVANTTIRLSAFVQYHKVFFVFAAILSSDAGNRQSRVLLRLTRWTIKDLLSAK